MYEEIINAIKKNKSLVGIVVNIHHELFVIEKDQCCMCHFTDGGICKFYGCPIFTFLTCNINDNASKSQYIFKRFENV